MLVITAKESVVDQSGLGRGRGGVKGGEEKEEEEEEEEEEEKVVYTEEQVCSVTTRYRV